MSFTCWGKDSDLKLTVPAAILSMLPPSATITGGNAGGSLFVSTSSTVTGSASGLDFLTGTVSLSHSKTGVPYK